MKDIQKNAENYDDTNIFFFPDSHINQEILQENAK